MGPAVHATPPSPDDELRHTLGLGHASRIRHLLTRALVIALAVAGALLVVRWWRARGDAKPPAYVTQPAAKGELTVTVTATGTLEARTVVDVGSEVSGKLKRVLVDFDDHVVKGQPLAEIDTELFQAQAEQARATLAQARAQLVTAQATQDEAKRTAARERGLFAQGVVSEQERESADAAARRADAAVALAQAQIAQATAALHVIETTLARSVIRAPIDGVVLDRTVEAGQTVVAAFQTPVLFRLAEDLRQMKVSVDVDEADVGLVRAGQTATFTVAAYLGRDFTARVAKVHSASHIVDRVVSYEAELDVDNRDLALRPGMTVTAQIVAAQVHGALLVPSQALRFTPPGEQEPDPSAKAKRVWILRDGRAVAVPVEAGPSNETQTEVRGALAPGDPVIVNAR